jgi:hypothetical protein
MLELRHIQMARTTGVSSVVFWHRCGKTHATAHYVLLELPA